MITLQKRLQAAEAANQEISRTLAEVESQKNSSGVNTEALEALKLAMESEVSGQRMLTLRGRANSVVSVERMEEKVLLVGRGGKGFSHENEAPGTLFSLISASRGEQFASNLTGLSRGRNARDCICQWSKQLCHLIPRFRHYSDNPEVCAYRRVLRLHRATRVISWRWRKGSKNSKLKFNDYPARSLLIQTTRQELRLHLVHWMKFGYELPFLPTLYRCKCSLNPPFRQSKAAELEKDNARLRRELESIASKMDQAERSHAIFEVNRLSDDLSKLSNPDWLAIVFSKSKPERR